MGSDPALARGIGLHNTYHLTFALIGLEKIAMHCRDTNFVCCTKFTKRKVKGSTLEIVLIIF